MIWALWEWVGFAFGVILAALVVCLVGACAGTFAGSEWHRSAIAPFEARIAHRLQRSAVGVSAEDQNRVTRIRAHVSGHVDGADDTRQRMQIIQALMGLEHDPERVARLTRLNAALSRRVEQRVEAAISGADTIEELERAWIRTFRREKARVFWVGITYSIRKSLASFSTLAAHATSHFAVWSVVAALIIWALALGRQKTVPDFDWLAYVGGWGALAGGLGLLYAILRTGHTTLRAIRTGPPAPLGLRGWTVVAIGFAIMLAGVSLARLDVDSLRTQTNQWLAQIPWPGEAMGALLLSATGAAFGMHQAVRAWRTPALKLSERFRGTAKNAAAVPMFALLATSTLERPKGLIVSLCIATIAVLGLGVPAIVLAERRELREMKQSLPLRLLGELPPLPGRRAVIAAIAAAASPLALAFPGAAKYSAAAGPIFIVLGAVGFALMARHSRRRAAYKSSLIKLYERTQLGPPVVQSAASQT